MALFHGRDALAQRSQGGANMRPHGTLVQSVKAALQVPHPRKGIAADSGLVTNRLRGGAGEMDRKGDYRRGCATASFGFVVLHDFWQV